MSEQTAVPTDTYPVHLARAKRLAARLLRDNNINPKTKLAHKLVYSVFYGVFNGDLPVGVSILLLAGRSEELIDKDVLAGSRP